MRNTSEAKIVVVGHDDLIELIEPTGVAVVAVETWLDALGEMTDSPASAVVGRIEPMGGTVASTAHALRELSPDARLILVVDPSREPQARQAVQNGFDDYLVEPMVGDQLLELLKPSAKESDRSADPLLALDLKEATSDAIQACDDQSLIDRLISRRGQLQDLAMQVIRGKLGTEGVFFLTQPNTEAKVCLPIQYQKQELGFLVSDQCDADELMPWVTWLGRWLALEKQINELHELALKDELTGVWNRRYFDRFLKTVLRRARRQRFRVTLLLFDIDNFKIYNDQYGHPAGDEILAEAAKLIQSLVREHDVVARIGGDEFAVIFWDAGEQRKSDSEHPREVQQVALRYQKAICQHSFPKLAELAPGTLTISGGLAAFPWDGQNPEDLIKIADDMLLQSKQQGKNAITLGPGALKACQNIVEPPQQ